jgi:hypothetical protein
MTDNIPATILVPLRCIPITMTGGGNSRKAGEIDTGVDGCDTAVVSTRDMDVSFYRYATRE